MDQQPTRRPRPDPDDERMSWREVALLLAGVAAIVWFCVWTGIVYV